MRMALRQLEHSLDRKIDDETKRLEDKLDRAADKIEDMRGEIPSRQFIEGQLQGLTERIDRSMDVKLAGR
jgi:hypothetical protein